MGSWQVCPHPLKQHFCAPGQLSSDAHASTQIPIPGGGQVPGFSPVVLPIEGLAIAIATNTTVIKILPISARFIIHSPFVF
jgi:hypothetical protein